MSKQALAPRDVSAFYLDLEIFLDPANAFGHPRDVLADCDLTIGEKRSILVIWAKQICAADAIPELPTSAGSNVPFDDVIDAIRMIDRIESRAVSIGHRPEKARRIRTRKLFGCRKTHMRRPERSIPISTSGWAIN
jgi:hypothetical protein